MIHEINQTGRIARDHPLLKYHSARILELSFSNFDDNVIATSSDDCTVRVCKFPDEITEDILKEDVCLSGHAKKPTCLAWHPTADNVLASSGNDKTLIVWDVESGEEAINCPDHEDLVFSISWNENGKYIGSSCQDK
jgi:WD40 repeat protein